MELIYVNLGGYKLLTSISNNVDPFISEKGKNEVQNQTFYVIVSRRYHSLSQKISHFHSDG
jgi:hypothetical protein